MRRIANERTAPGRHKRHEHFTSLVIDGIPTQCMIVQDKAAVINIENNPEQRYKCPTNVMIARTLSPTRSRPLPVPSKAPETMAIVWLHRRF
ncbi:hypothetical protein M5689_004644 [Euphorbia peplus]|nr:hypothetical protein M5689_004644 [Euphorbia peplus]